MNDEARMESASPQSRIVCFGGMAWNRKYALDQRPVLGTSNPASGSEAHGGVIRNVAENLVRLGVPVCMASIVGDDAAGRQLVSSMEALGAETDAVAVSDTRPTAEYVAIFDGDNELVLGLASMDIFDELQPAALASLWDRLGPDDWVAIDCNIPAETIAALAERRLRLGFRLAANTVSVSKGNRLCDVLPELDLLFTNRDEAIELLGLDGSTVPPLEDLLAMLLDRGVRGAVITDGPAGHVTAVNGERFRTSALARQVVNVSGAGDALMAGILYGLYSGATPERSSHIGAVLSALTVETDADVRPDLTTDSLILDRE